MTPSRVPAPGVIISVPDALERRALVDGHARAPMLVLVVRVGRVDGRTERREAIGLPRAGQRGRVGLGSREIVMPARFVGRRHRRR